MAEWPTRSPAPQEILAIGSKKTDASGNPVLEDVGTWMKREMKAAVKGADIKYIDPSYIVRVRERRQHAGCPDACTHAVHLVRPPAPFPPSAPACACGRAQSIPTISSDRIYCKVLAHNAVHAAFAGFTGITVGLVNTHYVYLPVSGAVPGQQRGTGERSG